MWHDLVEAMNRAVGGSAPCVGAPGGAAGPGEFRAGHSRPEIDARHSYRPLTGDRPKASTSLWRHTSRVSQRPGECSHGRREGRGGGLTREWVEPTLGLEPRTCCLRNSCSTTELCRRGGESSSEVRDGSNSRLDGARATALLAAATVRLRRERRDRDHRDAVVMHRLVAVSPWPRPVAAVVRWPLRAARAGSR